MNVAAVQGSDRLEPLVIAVIVDRRRAWAKVVPLEHEVAFVVEVRLEMADVPPISLVAQDDIRSAYRRLPAGLIGWPTCQPSQKRQWYGWIVPPPRRTMSRAALRASPRDVIRTLPRHERCSNHVGARYSADATTSPSTISTFPHSEVPVDLQRGELSDGLVSPRMSRVVPRDNGFGRRHTTFLRRVVETCPTRSWRAPGLRSFG